MKLSVIVIAMTFSGSVLAHSAGDILVKGGYSRFDGNTEFTAENRQDYFNENMSNESNGFSLSVTNMVSDNVGLDLTYNHGLKIDSHYNVTVKDYNTRHLSGDFSVEGAPITLTANYYFGNSQSKFRPFIGAGVAYTHFNSANSSSSSSYYDEWKQDTLLKHEVTPSLGLSAKAGFDYYLTDNLMVGASATYITSYADYNYTYVYKDSYRSEERPESKRLKINPLIATISIGYRF
ncbi:OmpW/AlkL family protein [Providencia sp. JUb39]|uniref:OmpW/AlkL family protein n=1 Tax=Providencia sp. JUb39 TaxID=2724165 RepID=UPI00164EB53F|nr:OmpW family outer membrane protein [Providencia sp. JUb39]MBC5790594.1 outer membrane beta-barrel protein [Providencia sp. JUb39]